MEIWQIAASLGTSADEGEQGSEDRALYLMRERAAGRKPKTRPAGKSVSTMLATVTSGGEV